MEDVWKYMKPAALKARPASADIKRRPVPATSREWDSTVSDLGEYRLTEKQLQAKVQARHASSKVSLWSQDFNLPFSRAFHSPQIDYNPLAELQKWEEIQRKEDASFSSAGRRCFTPPCLASHTNQPPLRPFSPTLGSRQAFLSPARRRAAHRLQPAGSRVGQGR